MNVTEEELRERVRRGYTWLREHGTAAGLRPHRLDPWAPHFSMDDEFNCVLAQVSNAGDFGSALGELGWFFQYSVAMRAWAIRHGFVLSDAEYAAARFDGIDGALGYSTLNELWREVVAEHQPELSPHAESNQ